MYELIAMDLDGTLTQHRSKLSVENKQILDHLRAQYRLVMVVAGSCKRVYDQMGGYPIDIVGNYGIQESTVVDGKFKITRDEKYTVDNDEFTSKIDKIRRKYGYLDYVGKSVEFHDSGMVTFPLLGTDANISDKIKFDPDRKKRSKMYDYIIDTFPDYNCFIGGSSSFDIVSREYNKSKALERYCLNKKIDVRSVLYVGDDFERGGNDEPIARGPFDFIVIRDYSRLKQALMDAGILFE